MEVKFFKQDLINKKYSLSIKLAVDELINGETSIINGKYSKTFEKNFAEFVGTRYCAFLSNGLDALTLALLTIGVTEDDEVIVPNHTYIATWLSVINVGAKVVAVPVKNNNLLIDENKIEEFITPKTKCILPVHLYGNIANMKRINQIAFANNLFVIDDAAQAHGSEVESKYVGNISDISCFSFYPTKNLGSLGEAGCVTTNNLEFIKKVKSLRNHGRSEKDKNENTNLGRNCRGDELQAAFLISKLKNLNNIKLQRQKIISKYKKEADLNHHKDWDLIDYCSGASPHLAIIRLDNLEIRNNLIKFLSEKSIETNIHYQRPCHKQPFLNKNQYHIDEVTAKQAKYISDTILTIPMSEVHTLKEIDYVAKCINDFFS